MHFIPFETWRGNSLRNASGLQRLPVSGGNPASAITASNNESMLPLTPLAGDRLRHPRSLEIVSRADKRLARAHDRIAMAGTGERTRSWPAGTGHA